MCDGARKRLDREPRRVAWYPGSEQRAQAFRAAMPGVEELGTVLQGGSGAKAAPSAYIPWLFKAGLSPTEVVKCSHSTLSGIFAMHGLVDTPLSMHRSGVTGLSFACNILILHPMVE